MNIELASSNTALAEEESGEEARSTAAAAAAVAVVASTIDKLLEIIAGDIVSATIVAASWTACVLILMPREEERSLVSATVFGILEERAMCRLERRLGDGVVVVVVGAATTTNDDEEEQLERQDVEATIAVLEVASRALRGMVRLIIRCTEWGIGSEFGSLDSVFVSLGLVERGADPRR